METTAKTWDVIGIGTAAVDDLLLVEDFPKPDSKVDILESTRQGGGQTATAMAAAARHEARAAFCCNLGFDDFSVFTMRELEKEGVDCSPCILTATGSPYHSTIIVDLKHHSRTILHTGGNVAPPDDHITQELIGRAKVLFLDDNSRLAGVKAAAIARKLGIPVIADFEPDPPPEYEKLLALIDHLVVGKEFAGWLSGEKTEAAMAEALVTQERSCCVVTAGERGCWYCTRGTRAVHAPGFAVQVVDTTGCGDVFHGVYAAAVARGEPVARAVRLANASAALKATQPGGRLGIPTLAQAEAFIRSRSS